jgi:HEAT repeat protein
LLKIVNGDSSLNLKEKAVFGLSQLPKKEGVPLLINIAKTHKDMNIREKAIFWLGQSKHPDAVKALEEIANGK